MTRPDIAASIRQDNCRMRWQNIMDQAVCGWDFRYTNPADLRTAAAGIKDPGKWIERAMWALFAVILFVLVAAIALAAVGK